MTRKGKKRDLTVSGKTKTPNLNRTGMGAGAAILAILAWFTGGISWESVLEWIKTIAIAGGLALTARWAIGEPYKIPSGSMEPTLHGDARFLRGDRVFVNKWIYGLRFPFNHARIPFLGKPLDYATRRIFRGADPKRWEIVVFKSVEKNAKHGTLVKRIVGLPGERVLIHEGKIFINGKPLTLPEDMPKICYTREGRYGVIPADEFTVIPPDHYFVLGDNSSASRDGRYWGWVPNEHILGRVSCIAWPPNRWRDFTGFSKTLWWRTLVALLLATLCWRIFLGQSWKVLGVSPDRELEQGDHLYISKISWGLPVPFKSLRLFRCRMPKRGTMVLYKSPVPNQYNEMSIGRVAALPGEKVQIKDGKLFINDEPMSNGPFREPIPSSASDISSLYGRSAAKEYSQVPPEHVFIISTAGDAGRDGRALGWTHKNLLKGEIKFIWLPVKRIKKFTLDT